MFSIYKKSIFLLFTCAIIFLLADIEIAQAEVTCCVCGREICSVVRGDCTIGWTGFACMSDSPTCNVVCRDGETPQGITREGTWVEFIAAGEQRRASGRVVTCCNCSSTYICIAENRRCDGENGICGEREYEGGVGNYIRKETEVAAESITPAEEKQEIKIVPPELETFIPGFHGFSEVKVEGGYISLPWIAEYVSAIFNWLMMIVGGIATVMIMIGGFIYLTAAGNQGMISKAKEIITNALIGLLLAVGSYLILYTINPDLVSFKNVRLKVIERGEMEFEPPADRESFAGDTGSTSSVAGDCGGYESIINRVAEEFGLNACFMEQQFRMESRCNTNAGTGCCFGLGQIHWRNAQSMLSNESQRSTIIENHSAGCPSCPAENASREEVSTWLRNDPESNIILSAMLKRSALRSAGNPITAVAMYGMGIGSYRSYTRATNCSPERFDEEQLIERLRSGASVESLMGVSCIPPATWPLPDSQGVQRSCPPANHCCRPESSPCTQPAIRRVDGVNQGRWGICQGGTRDGQECAAVAGGDVYVRSFLRSIQRCIR